MHAPRNTLSDQGTSVSWLLVFAVATTLLVWLLFKLGLSALTPMFACTLVGPIL